jgi:hypothetical protein
METDTQIHCFFIVFFFATSDLASGSCFGFLHGHPFPMVIVALAVVEILANADVLKKW